MTPVHPPTFPARPVNGGPLPRALPKRGVWCYEPKVNGWRAIIHCPSGAMFNRHGARLSIEAEFSTVLVRLRSCPIEWLDCEALERRLPIGKGSLIILDAVIPGDYGQRMQAIADAYPEAAWTHEQIPQRASLLRFATTFSESEAKTAWPRLQDINRAVGCELFEGLVAKRVDSKYPVQLRSASEEFAGWMKHRWAF